LDVVPLGLDGDGLSHVGIDAGPKVMPADLRVATALPALRHGHHVTPDAPVIVPDDRDPRRQEVGGQIAVDQVALSPPPAHVPVAVHEPAAGHHEHDWVTGGAGTKGWDIDLPGELRPAVTGPDSELLRFHVVDTVRLRGRTITLSSGRRAQRQ